MPADLASGAVGPILVFQPSFYSPGAYIYRKLQNDK
jgi:hypothetical protein